MTDKEIIKALECCSQGITIKSCENCPLNSADNVINLNCLNLEKSCIDLINRQQAEIETVKAHEEKEHQYCKNVCEPKYKAEIERLTARNFELAEKGEKVVIAFKNAKAEAIKECLEKIEQIDISESDDYIMVKKNRFNNLVKEMVGED